MQSQWGILGVLLRRVIKAGKWCTPTLSVSFADRSEAPLLFRKQKLVEQAMSAHALTPAMLQVSNPRVRQRRPTRTNHQKNSTPVAVSHSTHVREKSTARGKTRKTTINWAALGSCFWVLAYRIVTRPSCGVDSYERWLKLSKG